MPVENKSVIGSHGFRNWYAWGPKGELLETGGARYMLSTLLGVTYGRGNSVAEILAYLRDAAAADGTHPTGTIYFMDNKADPARNSPRSPNFDIAVKLLAELKIDAEVVPGDLPRNKPRVQGLMSGVASFDWPATGSVIQRGAICDNLTSFGGDLDPAQVQTPLSIFLRFGAAAPAERWSSRWRFLTSFRTPSFKYTTRAAARWPRRSISRSMPPTSS